MGLGVEVRSPNIPIGVKQNIFEHQCVCSMRNDPIKNMRSAEETYTIIPSILNQSRFDPRGGRTVGQMVNAQDEGAGVLVHLKPHREDVRFKGLDAQPMAYWRVLWCPGPPEAR